MHRGQKNTEAEKTLGFTQTHLEPQELLTEKPLYVFWNVGRLFDSGFRSI